MLERARIGAAASGASAAGVRAMGRDPAERALALASLARWPGLERELEESTRYRRTGGLRLALDEAAWRAAGPWVAEQRADGVPVEIVDAQAACALAPGIAAGCLGGVHAPIDGQAEALPATEAFAHAARRLGARVEEGARRARARGRWGPGGGRRAWRRRARGLRRGDRGGGRGVRRSSVESA